MVRFADAYLSARRMDVRLNEAYMRDRAVLDMSKVVVDQCILVTMCQYVLDIAMDRLCKEGKGDPTH